MESSENSAQRLSSRGKTPTAESRPSPASGREGVERPNSQREDRREDFQVLMEGVGKAIGDYSQQRPGVAGGVLFAIGFFVGWRLRPW